MPPRPHAAAVKGASSSVEGSAAGRVWYAVRNPFLLLTAPAGVVWRAEGIAMAEVPVGSSGRSVPVIVLVILAALAALGVAWVWPW